MARRTKKEKKLIAKDRRKSGSKHGKNMRFHVSLILLSAILEISLFILLISLIGAQTRTSAARAFPLADSPQKAVKSTGGSLDDSSLDYTLSVPDQIGEWLYKTGYVKSLTNAELSDQYLQIFLPIDGKVKSRNLEDMAKNILTIKRFTSGEWKKLDSGCQKDNQLYCEAIGTKIDEQNGNVYTYIKDGDCPKQMKAKCGLVNKIIGSFKLK